MIKVGQIYTNYGKIYAVTLFEDNKVYIINNDGRGQFRPVDNIHRMTLVKSYPTWQEAVNSKEFNGDIS